MIDNAVSYYRHLREQDVKPADALDHAVQRYGVKRDDLTARINGFVVDGPATRAALAEVRAVLSSPHDNDDHGALLRKLYNAVTGESL